MKRYPVSLEDHLSATLWKEFVEAFTLVQVAALYLVASVVLIWAIGQRQQRVAPATTASEAQILSQQKEDRP